MASLLQMLLFVVPEIPVPGMTRLSLKMAWHPLKTRSLYLPEIIINKRNAPPSGGWGVFIIFITYTLHMNRLLLLITASLFFASTASAQDLVGKANAFIAMSL